MPKGTVQQRKTSVNNFFKNFLKICKNLFRAVFPVLFLPFPAPFIHLDISHFPDLYWFSDILNAFSHSWSKKYRQGRISIPSMKAALSNMSVCFSDFCSLSRLSAPCRSAVRRTLRIQWYSPAVPAAKAFRFTVFV